MKIKLNPEFHSLILFLNLTNSTIIFEASGSAWGIYFLIYNTLKSRQQNQGGHKHNLTVTNYTLDATIAGVTTILITNPLFLIKTRMCLQYAQAGLDNTGRTVLYKSSWHAFKTLLATDGFVGLYKGIIPGLFGTLNGTIQVYNFLGFFIKVVGFKIIFLFE